jgi:putative ABC transport system permease protein
MKPGTDVRRPPRIPLAILKRTIHGDIRAGALGDFEELFAAAEEQSGSKKARRWFWRQAFGSLPDFLIDAVRWRLAMFLSYLKIAIRNIRKFKIFSFINVFGLAVGTAFCILAFLFIRHEWSHDAFHADADRIYLLHHILPNEYAKKPVGSTPPCLARALQGALPEIERVVRIAGYGLEDGVPVRAEERSLNRSGLYADPEFFETFSFPSRFGDLRRALSGLDSVVLSDETAGLYFPKENPVGKKLSILIRDKAEDFLVTGVVDLPKTSSFRFDFLLSYARVDKPDDFSWDSNNVYTFVKTVPGVRAPRLKASLTAFFESYFQFDPASKKNTFGNRNRPLRPLPLKDMYLNTVIQEGLTTQSNPAYALILAGIALSVLLVAGVNFMNLSLALSSNRIKEVGIRKVVGASQANVMRQFLAESILLSVAAFILGLILAAFALPVFNTLMRRSLALDLSRTWPLLAGLALIIGAAAGSYPAFVLSRFRPQEVFKSRGRKSGAGRLGKALVLVQFSVSIVMIIAALAMSGQVRHMRAKNLGFNPQQVVVVDCGPYAGAKPIFTVVDRLRQAAAQNPGITGVTMASMVFGTPEMWGTGFVIRGEDVTCRTFVVDYDYAKTLGIPLFQGRDFDPKFPADEKKSILINRRLARLLEPLDPLGLEIRGSADNSMFKDAVVVGILEDANLQSLRYEIDPAVYQLRSGNGDMRYIFVRFQSERLADIMERLRKIWKENLPDQPFTFSFLDQDVDRIFREDGRWADISTAAAFFAVFIAGLGAFGLTSLAVVRRTKEIGIRKVLGAGESRIAWLVTREFIVVVAAANLLAWPVDFYFLQTWLQGFAYRISLGAGIFVAGSLITFFIALAAIGAQVVKAARAQPVRSLRYE